MAWRARVRPIGAEIAARFGRHHLWTYASAVAFRALVAAVPLLLLGLALLSAFGLEDFWSDSAAPAIERKVTPPVAAAIEHSVDKIFSTSAGPLIAFASALLLWDLAWAMTTSMEALNEIHDVDEPRPWWRRYLVGAALAVVVIVCLVSAVLAVVLGPRPEGILHVIFGIGRWPLAILLLGLGVALIVRYAPADHPEPRWASAGSVLVVASWILASLVFRWWVGAIASFKTAIGSLAVFLVLSAYVFTSAAIFLIGVELDEILRKQGTK
jgi:membrane protein